MNIAPFIFIGLFATFSFSWFAYVFRPQADLGKMEPFKDPISGQVYPIARMGLAQQGAEVYRAQNCAACHTQQVRSEKEGNDLDRGWGTRRTVAADFMLEHPPLLGSVRLGPDLANMGLRKGTNEAPWHFQHLLAPQSIPKLENSKMPPYPYLFKKRKAENRGGEFYTDPKHPGFEFVPTPDARALVAYLISLKSIGPVFEAPMPVSTNAPAGGTNAPAGDTNAPPATNTVMSATNAPAK